MMCHRPPLCDGRSSGPRPGHPWGDEAEVALSAETELEDDFIEVEVVDAGPNPLEEGLHLDADSLPLRRHVLLAALDEIRDLSVVLLCPRRRLAQSRAGPDEHDELPRLVLGHAPPSPPSSRSSSSHTFSIWVSMWTRRSVAVYTLRT